MIQANEKYMGKRLQLARQKAGLTQQALCQKAGLSYSTLAKIERGAIRAPSVFTIQNIAQVLNVSVDALVGAQPNEIGSKHFRSKSGISFVYFDVNGCLVYFYQRAFNQIAMDCDLSPDEVEMAYWHYNDQACRGVISMSEFNRSVGKRLLLSNFDWSSYYLAAAKPVPCMVELIKWVSERYGLGLLTNIMPTLVDRMRQKGLIPDVNYDVIIDSSKVHLLKPEKKIYELATAKAGCAPSEILFIDDSRSNLMAAEKLGWHILWFDEIHPEESVSRIRKILEVG